MLANARVIAAGARGGRVRAADASAGTPTITPIANAGPPAGTAGSRGDRRAAVNLSQTRFAAAPAGHGPTAALATPRPARTENFARSHHPDHATSQSRQSGRISPARRKDPLADCRAGRECLASPVGHLVASA